MKTKLTCKALITAALASGACVTQLQAQQSADALINKLVQKGILTEKEAKEIMAEGSQTNNAAVASKWKIDKAIKEIGLFGDVRFRYEYRGTENAPGSGTTGNAFYRERWRYALRLGVRGDLFDNFYYGLRVETSSNPRSPWVTFANDTGSTANSPGTPFDKSKDGVNVGQIYLGWKPTDWYEMTVGRMPMPLYVTPMIWDSDLAPEGAVEKFKFALPPVDLFANFGQFIYQDTDLDQQLPSGDTFMLAFQVGAAAKLAKDITLKVAPVVYAYTGKGSSTALTQSYSGEGVAGLNPASTPASNQSGLNDLAVIEVPAELNFKVGKHAARLFGDFAYNFEGDDRAQAAFVATQSGPNKLPRVFHGEDKAYQAGLAYGNMGVVYGTASKKNTWEARVVLATRRAVRHGCESPGLGLLRRPCQPPRALQRPGLQLHGQYHRHLPLRPGLAHQRPAWHRRQKPRFARTQSDPKLSYPSA